MKVHKVLIKPMTPENAKGLGRVVKDFKTAEVDVVPWPARGWRPVARGDERGVSHGIFETRWRGEVLYGRADNFETEYVVGWSRDPEAPRKDTVEGPRDRLFVGLVNYHPDGGQVFFSRNRKPFLLLLGKPGDDVKPEDFVALQSDGSVGFHIGSDVWHKAPFTLTEADVFDRKQGNVHACIECDFPNEQGLYLSVPLPKP